MAARFAPMSPDQLGEWRRQLSEWNDCAKFHRQVDEIVSAVPEPTFFNQGGLQFIRDAWVGSRVASALSAESVRLGAAERPDFEAVICEEIVRFEVTEAMREGRRRGDEFLNPPHGWVDDTAAAIARFRDLPRAVGHAVARKVAKNYDADVALVIYVPEGSYGWFREEGTLLLREATRLGSSRFSQILVLWEGAVFRFWYHGRESAEVWDPQVRNDD